MDFLKILLTVSGEINSKAKVINYFKGTATAEKWGVKSSH